MESVPSGGDAWAGEGQGKCLVNERRWVQSTAATACCSLARACWISLVSRFPFGNAFRDGAVTKRSYVNAPSHRQAGDKA
jgi:hypothetical protein